MGKRKTGYGKDQNCARKTKNASGMGMAVDWVPHDVTFHSELGGSLNCPIFFVHKKFWSTNRKKKNSGTWTSHFLTIKPDRIQLFICHLVSSVRNKLESTLGLACSPSLARQGPQ